MTTETAAVLGQLFGIFVFGLLTSLILSGLVWLVRGRKRFWSSWFLVALLVFGILIFRHFSAG